jgi:hypothetical protein
MSWIFVSKAYELTSFESLVASRRSRSLSQASSKSYITKESLGKEEEEFRVLLCCPTAEASIITTRSQ